MPRVQSQRQAGESVFIYAIRTAMNRPAAKITHSLRGDVEPLSDFYIELITLCTASNAANPEQ
jgi:hypothetical protein